MIFWLSAKPKASSSQADAHALRLKLLDWIATNGTKAERNDLH